MCFLVSVDIIEDKTAVLISNEQKLHNWMESPKRPLKLKLYISAN